MIKKLMYITPVLGLLLIMIKSHPSRLFDEISCGALIGLGCYFVKTGTQSLLVFKRSKNEIKTHEQISGKNKKPIYIISQIILGIILICLSSVKLIKQLYN